MRFSPRPVRSSVQQIIDVLRGKIVLSRPLGNAESALGKGVLHAFPERQRNVRPSSVCLVHIPSLSCAPSRFRVGVVLEVVVFRGSLETNLHPLGANVNISGVFLEEKMGTIGERIRELRGKLSREAFAAKYTIHRNTVERYEKNLGSPDTLFLQELARQENVNLEWVQTGAEPKYKKELRRVAGLQAPQSRQPIENIGVDTAKSCDSRNFLEIQHQNFVLQERLSGALEKGMEAQEKIATLTEQNADLRIQLERKDSRIRDLEREAAEIPALKARITELERELSERPKLPKTVPVDVSAKSKPTPAHGAGTDTTVVPGTSAGVSGVGNLGAVVRKNGE